MSAHCFRRSNRISDRYASQSADFRPESHWLLLGHDKLLPGGHRSEIAHLSSRGNFHGARRRRFLPAEYGHGRQIYGRSVGSARDTGPMARRVSAGVEPDSRWLHNRSQRGPTKRTYADESTSNRVILLVPFLFLRKFAQLPVEHSSIH